MPYDFREDFDKPLARAVGAPDTITLNGETLRRVVPALQKSVDYRSDHATIYRTVMSQRWYGTWYSEGGARYAGPCATLAEVVEWLTVREPWWRRVWRWCCGG